MKFPKLHYERIVELIRSNGFGPEDFYLVKRKGWIRIEYAATGEFFTYFKKKETIIDPDSKLWENSLYFKIRINKGAEIILGDFESMLETFENWVREISKE